MDKYQMMPVARLRGHPLNDQTFGPVSDDDYARMYESIKAHGIKIPLEVTPEDAEQNPNCVVDGNTRLDIAQELQIEYVPVVVRPELRTEADQVLRALELAKRRQYSEGQRAMQEEAARKVIAAAAPEWKRARGFDGMRESEVVSALVHTPVRSINRRKKVFFGPTSTELLRSAVDQGKLSLRRADDLISEIEKAYRAGSSKARTALDERVAAFTGDELPKKRKRRPRRTTLFRKGVQPHEVWRDFRDMVKRCLIAEITPIEPHELPGEVEFRIKAAFLDFQGTKPKAETVFQYNVAALKLLVERFEERIKTMVAEFRDDARRINEWNYADPPDTILLRAEFRVLGLLPPQSGQAIDMELVSAAYRHFARRYHPDVAGPGGAEKFRRIQTAYDRIQAVATGR